MPTFAFVTFGCKVNQYEGQALREDLVRRGYFEVAPDRPADLFVINSCTVTETACREAEVLVRTLGRRHPRSRIAVTGCAADSNRGTFLGLPGVRSVIAHADKQNLAELVDGDAPADADIFGLEISRFDDHTRAFVKIEDGCDLCCTFCIIPQVRGGPVSRPMEAVIDEVRRLLDNGYREIVLTGVHLGAYGKDLEQRSMIPDLVERMLQLPVTRIRLSSIEVNEIDGRLLDLMASEPRFCPHLHLPLQSGDDAILRVMRRRYNSRQFVGACERVAERIPDPGLTTDVIVGFPGETEEQFDRTVEVCRRTSMSRIHIFPYSPRSGTAAASMADDIPPHVKQARTARLRREAAKLTRDFASRFVGREVEVLLEMDGGYTERYLRARVDGRRNEFVRARVAEARNGELVCQKDPVVHP